MRDFKKIYFILIYLVTPTLLYTLPATFYVPLKIFFLSSNVFILLNLIKSNRFLIESSPLFFSISLFLLSLIVVFYKSLHWTTPFYYLTGYISYIQYKYIGNIQRHLEWLILFSYIYFFVIYFSGLPSFLYRPDFDENVFDLSSSNTIAIVLNVYLYAYLLLGFYHNNLNHKKVLLYSLINIVLILIQQSRIGLVVAIIISLLPRLSGLKKSTIARYLIPTFILIVFYYVVQIYSANLRGGDFSIDGYLLDSRGIIQFLFFSDLTGDKVFWGYPLDYIYFGGLSRVYNLFLLNYNYTTIIGFIIIIYFFFTRILNSKRFVYKTIMLSPLFLYAMVEEIFLPMSWDFILYLLLFLKSKQFKQRIKTVKNG